MGYKHSIPYYVFIILVIKTINGRYSKFWSPPTKAKLLPNFLDNSNKKN
jgi:hypothetical protein